MNDGAIVELFWRRQESAITQTSRKYGAYLKAIATGVMGNASDAEECVNDTYLGAWNAMPSERPTLLKAFVGKICRNVSLKCWRSQTAQKRGGGEVALSLDELEECVEGAASAEGDALGEMEFERLVGALDRFLDSLPADTRRMFVCRYWYFDPIAAIAGRLGCSESKVKMTLKRTRDALAVYLRQEGVQL